MIGGTAVLKTEVIDLYNPSITCQMLPDIQFSTYGMNWLKYQDPKWIFTWTVSWFLGLFSRYWIFPLL